MPNSPAGQMGRRSRKSVQFRPSSRNFATGEHAPTKLDTIEKLLLRSKGASIDELSTVTGWQAHSVRAALTLLRQRDIAIVREIAKGNSRYRIVAQ